MIKNVLHLTALYSTVVFSANADAQSSVIPDVIAAMVSSHPKYTPKPCLEGMEITLLPVAPVQSTIQATMSDYVRIAGSAKGVDATSTFTAKSSLREWRHGASSGSVNAVDDPFARALAAEGRMLPSTTSVYIAGDTKSALAVWHVAENQYYRALFRPESRTWKLQRVELIEGAAFDAAISRYCNVPGDVEKYQAQLAQKQSRQP